MAPFAGTRTKLQVVRWKGAIVGFDDEYESTLIPELGSIPQFLILKLPEQFEWYAEINQVSSIPIEVVPAAEGGSVPAVNLDTFLPGKVKAVCVFPYDDATDILFSTSTPTLDDLRQIHYTNFDKVRWVRPENIRIIRSFK